MQTLYAQKVGVVWACRAIMIVNKIHDVTMYNASSQWTRSYAKSRIPAHAYIEKTEWIIIARKLRSELNNLTILHANFTLAERRKTRTECKYANNIAFHWAKPFEKNNIRTFISSKKRLICIIIQIIVRGRNSQTQGSIFIGHTVYIYIFFFFWGGGVRFQMITSVD